MSTALTPPWPARLACARRILGAAAKADAPGWVLDQERAAISETSSLFTTLAAALPAADDRRWGPPVCLDPDQEHAAALLAALLGCAGACAHLRRGAPRPATVRLALRRADCDRCVHTVRRPPADEADRCDACGRRGVEQFTPLVATWGTVLVVGDLCGTCAALLVPAPAAAP